MYQHKLCSATYLPLDMGHHPPTSVRVHERPPCNRWFSEPYREKRSPSLKLSRFLRQAQPTRSASALFRKSPKANKPSNGRTQACQSPPSRPSRYDSIRRRRDPSPRLLPAFPAPEPEISRDLNSEKPLPSEPENDLVKLFRYPLPPERLYTAADDSEKMSTPTRRSLRRFTRDALKADSSSTRSGLTLKLNTPHCTESKCSCTCAALPCEELHRQHQRGSAGPVQVHHELDGQSSYFSGDGKCQSGITSKTRQQELRPSSPCELLSEGRKIFRERPRKASGSMLSQSEAGWLSGSLRTTSRMGDASSTSLIGPGPSAINTKSEMKSTEKRTVKPNDRDMDGTGKPLVCISPS